MTARSASVPSLCNYCGDPNCTIHYGLCHCGCGRRARISHRNNAYFGRVKGVPLIFLNGHNGVARRHLVEQPEDTSTRLIALTRGQTAIVDADDFAALSLRNWRAQWCDKTRGFYAVRSEFRNGAETSMMMHTEIMPAPDGFVIDHASRNTLDNRKRNLRIATASQNGINSGMRSNNTSGYRGVSWNKKFRKWVASIRHGGHLCYLGSYDRIEDAAEARRKKEIELFGEFSPLAQYASSLSAARTLMDSSVITVP